MSSFHKKYASDSHVMCGLQVVTGFLLALHCFSYKFSALCLLSVLINVFLLVNYTELRFYLHDLVLGYLL